MALRVVPLSIAAAAVLLAACEARVGGKDEGVDAAPLEGSAEEGTFSMDLPGFEMKVRIPEGMRQRATVNEDNQIIPPGASFRGIHVQADRAGESGVEMRFTDPRPTAELAEWYQADASGREFRITSAERRGEGWVIAGETLRDPNTFTVRLAPGPDGGTEGRIAIVDRSG